VYSDTQCQRCFWISGQHQQHSLQQQQQQQHGGDEHDESKNVYANGELAAQSNPDVVYADIVASNQGHNKVMSSNMKNNDDAVIYSDLEDAGAGARTVAPSDNLYANI